MIRDFAHWRRHARSLLAAHVPPEVVDLADAGAAQPNLLPDAPIPEATGRAVTVPREYLQLAETCAQYRDPQRWNLLYRVLYRIGHGEPHLLRVDIDDDIRQLRLMEKAIRRDIHKMHAFVRFREIQTERGTEYVAWHRPDHLIVEAATPFFARRFGAMRWAILTPDCSAYWDLETLRFGPGMPRSAAPAADDLETLWRTYYGSIFNPSRVNIRAMTLEMPSRHWATLPETDILTQLLHDADSRVLTMIEKQAPSAQPFVPPSRNVHDLARAAKACQGCTLYQHATQTVFGHGPAKARVMLVGEQPGDQEDLTGKPFTGPAGQLLDRALAEAQLARGDFYITNAVKHFKFTERGKRRIHEKPSGVEVSACRPWLEAELAAVDPELIVCLGATAAQSLMGRDFRISTERGQLFAHRWVKGLMATIHPSAILRMPEERQQEEYALFVQDLRRIPVYLG